MGEQPKAVIFRMMARRLVKNQKIKRIKKVKIETGQDQWNPYLLLQQKSERVIKPKKHLQGPYLQLVKKRIIMRINQKLKSRKRETKNRSHIKKKTLHLKILTAYHHHLLLHLIRRLEDKVKNRPPGEPLQQRKANFQRMNWNRNEFDC